MKKSLALTVIIGLVTCTWQFAYAQGSKAAKAQGSSEANRLAREGAEAAKNQDLDKAVELLRKATNLDHKYADELAAVYQRRAYAFAKNQQFQEAIQDYTEAIKIEAKDPRIYEQRAAVEMKMYDYDKALADYSELIKLKPNETRYLNYRAYVYEVKARKQRVEQKQAERMPLTPPPSPASSPKGSPAGKKKPGTG